MSDPSAAPQVTVIIPTRDRGGPLLRSLGSALGQVGVDVEVVVVDDGSSCPVTSLPELESACTDRRVKVLRNERSKGVAAARNRGISVASAPWLAFLDDDDIWAPEKLSVQLGVLADHPGRLWSYTGEVILRDDLTVLWTNAGPPAQAIDARLLENNRIPGGGSSVLADRDAVAGLGGFDESFSILADWDLWLRLALRSPPAPVEAAMVGYVEHAGGMSHDIDRCLAEFKTIELKYRDLRRVRGVSIGRHDFLLWLADLDRRSGRRCRAARLSAHAAIVGRDPRALAFALATIAWPGFGAELDRRARGKCSPALQQTAAGWLTPIG